MGALRCINLLLLLPIAHCITKNDVFNIGLGALPLKPTLVRTSLYIHDIQEINTEEESMTAVFHLRLNWSQPELKRSPSMSPLVIESAAIRSNIWKPDLYLRNQITLDSETSEALSVDSDGSLTYSKLYRVKMACPMKLRMYPFDTQTCNLELISCEFDDLELPSRDL